MHRDPVSYSTRTREGGEGETDLVQAGHDVRQVEPGRAGVGHLMEKVVAEQLEQVAVTRLRPTGVHAEPAGWSQTDSRLVVHLPRKYDFLPCGHLDFA